MTEDEKKLLAGKAPQYISGYMDGKYVLKKLVAKLSFDNQRLKAEIKTLKKEAAEMFRLLNGGG